MMQIPKDITELESAPVDIWDIEMRMRHFYRLIDTDDEEPDEARIRSIQARRALDSARLLLRNLLEPEHNRYIKEQEISYNWMLDNLGRADKRLDKVEEDTIVQLENARVISNKLGNTAKLTIYQKTLFEYMEHLVYFPLKNSYKKFILFKDEEGKKIKRDSKLYLYFVFLSLFHASEMLGAVTREEVKSIPKGFGLATGITPTKQRGQEESGQEGSAPPEFPKNPDLESAIKELNKGKEEGEEELGDEGQEPEEESEEAPGEEETVEEGEPEPEEEGSGEDEKDGHE